MTNTGAGTVAFLEYLNGTPATRTLAVGLCEVLALRSKARLIPVEIESDERRAAS